MGAAGCSSGSTSAPARSGAAAAAAAPAPSASMADGMAMGTSATGSEEGAALGVRLQALVAQHSVLVADMMRARVRKAPDVAQAADAALGKNTQALGTLVDGLFGAAAGKQFAGLWAGHIRYLFAYADAQAAHDADAAKAARTDLEKAEQELGSFFASASQGRLPAPAAQGAVKAHIDHLLAQADAYAKGDYAAAATAYQEGYQHGFEMGGALAAALLPKADADKLQDPQWKLRAALTDLLGDHVSLVVAAMRAVSGAQADFKALSTGLNQNTVALASAVDSLFGAAPAKQFQNLWADHVDALMAYTAASGRGDAAAQSQAQKRLRSFEPALATFLAAATKSQLGAQALAHAYLEHDRMLVGELTAYQDKDYSRAHELSYQAYEQMFDLSAQLSHAIGVTLGQKLPKGGSQTGGGGMATVVGRR